MKNWKTTATGVIALIVALGNIAEALISGRPVDWAANGTAIVTAVGLIFAKDHNVTGGTTPQ